MYMKYCNVLIEPIAERIRRKGTNTYKKVVCVEREEEIDAEVEMIVRRRWTKKVNKLVMRCFYQSYPTRRGCQKQMIAIW